MGLVLPMLCSQNCDITLVLGPHLMQPLNNLMQVSHIHNMRVLAVSLVSLDPAHLL